MGLLKGQQQQDVSQQRRLPTNDINSDVVKSLSETVSLYYYHATTGVYTADAGQVAGIVVVGTLAQSNILNAAGDVLGTILDTSFAWTTGTILTTQVAFPNDVAELHDTNTGTLKAQAITSGFSNGDYCIDHEAGIIYGVKATAGTSDTGTYKVFSKLSGGGGGVASDINVDQLGGVDTPVLGTTTYTEATSTGIIIGAVRNDALAALAGTDNEIAPFQVNASGALYVTDALLTDIPNVIGTDGSGGPSKCLSVAGTNAGNIQELEVTADGELHVYQDVAANLNCTEASAVSIKNAVEIMDDWDGTAFTETLALATNNAHTAGLCYGIDADNAGAPILAALQVAVDNATISATPNVLVTGGAYKAALDTYNDNDASPFHMNADGTLLVTVNGLAGSIAHSGVDAGNPIKVGGRAVDSQIAAVTAADRTDQVFSLYGETISRSHTYGSQSDRAEEVDPIDEHYVEEELVDDTNITGGTIYYPSTTGRAMGNFNNVSMHYVTSGGVTTTIEAKIDDSTDWIDITPAGYELATNATGAASFVDTSGIVDYDDLHVRTIRVKSVTADATNGVQYHIKLSSL